MISLTYGIQNITQMSLSRLTDTEHVAIKKEGCGGGADWEENIPGVTPTRGSAADNADFFTCYQQLSLNAFT